MFPAVLLTAALLAGPPLAGPPAAAVSYDLTVIEEVEEVTENGTISDVGFPEEGRGDGEASPSDETDLGVGSEEVLREDDSGEGEGGGEIEDESAADSDSNTVIVITPDDLAAILQDADDIALLADFGVTGDSLLSGSFLTYCQGLADRIPWGSHYVAWRDDSDYYSDSYFAYGDLTESNGQFSGDVRILRYYRQSSNSDYRLSWSHDSNFELDASNGFAYSDLGEFPALNGGETFEKALLWLVGFDIVAGFVLSILLGRYTRF